MTLEGFTRLTVTQLEEAGQVMARVRQIDAAIEWLGRDAPDKVEGHGKALRLQLGRNRLPIFTDDKLGEIALCAVINAMLDERARLASLVEEVVKLPDPPCPRQVVQEGD